MTFEEYMEDKFSNPTGNHFEDELNEAIFSLYQKGYIRVDMKDGEPMFSITEAGELASTEALAMMMPVAEA